MSVALAVFALVLILATIPVVDTLFAGRNIENLDVERVKTIVLGGGFLLLVGSCIAVGAFWNKTQEPWEKSKNPRGARDFWNDPVADKGKPSAGGSILAEGSLPRFS